MKMLKKNKLKNQTFLTSKQYNKVVDKRNGNCLSFAFSQTLQNFENFDLLTIKQIEKLENHQPIEEVDICEAFINKAKEFGYNVKQINSIKGMEGKVVFIVLGWYTQYIEDFGKYDYFFHIIRKNEDGSFEQKLDWSTPAKLVSFSKIKKYLNLGIESHYFVLM